MICSLPGRRTVLCCQVLWSDNERSTYSYRCFSLRVECISLSMRASAGLVTFHLHFRFHQLSTFLSNNDACSLLMFSALEDFCKNLPVIMNIFKSVSLSIRFIDNTKPRLIIVASLTEFASSSALWWKKWYKFTVAFNNLYSIDRKAYCF